MLIEYALLLIIFIAVFLGGATLIEIIIDALYTSIMKRINRKRGEKG